MRNKLIVMAAAALLASPEANERMEAERERQRKEEKRKPEFIGKRPLLPEDERRARSSRFMGVYPNYERALNLSKPIPRKLGRKSYRP